jgi:hypothetical protein
MLFYSISDWLLVENGSCHVCKKNEVRLLRNAYGHPMEEEFIIDETKGVVLIKAGGLRDDALYSCSNCGAPLPQYGTIEEAVKNLNKSIR